MSSLDDARRDTRARLAASRAEIRRLLKPPSAESAGASATPDFPRSRTMRWLMKGRGAGTVGAIAGGMLIARPALAFRLLRRLPTGSMGLLVLVKALSALRKPK